MSSMLGILTPTTLALPILLDALWIW
jgi:hypothetical protein